MSGGKQSDAVAVCKEALNLLDLCGGWIKSSGDGFRFRTLWKQNEPSVTESEEYIFKDFALNGEPGLISPTSKPGLISQYLRSPIYAHLHCYEESPSKKFCIDLWSDVKGLMRRYDISGNDLHGSAYTDTEFSSLGFSQNGEYLVYLAEKNPSKGVSFYKENAKHGDVRGNVYDFKESWGEQLDEACNSVICVLTLESGEIQVLNTPESVFCASPAWSGNNLIYFNGFETGMKLGAVYCTNRRSRIHSYNLDTGIVVAHTPVGKSVTKPHPGPLGQVAFLMCDADGPHRDYMEINYLLPDGTVHSVPDGWCSGSLSPSPWINDYELAFQTYEGATQQIYYIITTNGNKENVVTSPYFSDKGVFSFSILDQVDEHFLISFSHLNPISDVYKQGVAYMKLSLLREEVLILIGCDESSNPPSSPCSYSVKEFVRDGRSYNGILVEPGSDSPNLETLVVFPHGGPHSVFTTTFSLQAYTLTKLGYSILMINYTGSLGLGADSIHALLSNIGDMDVKDVHHAAMEVARSFKKVAVMGGSHGGFLTAHLIGQYPDIYKVAALRNPVIDISTMVGSTDIPDWTFTETGLQYDSVHPPLPDVNSVTAMLEKSPIQYVDRVKCPTLLLIGGKDLRVPPTQGIRYYKYLRSRGVVCQLKLYPKDSHPLGGVPCTADCLLQIHYWFQQHLQQ